MDARASTGPRGGDAPQARAWRVVDMCVCVCVLCGMHRWLVPRVAGRPLPPWVGVLPALPGDEDAARNDASSFLASLHVLYFYFLRSPLAPNPAPPGSRGRTHHPSRHGRRVPRRAHGGSAAAGRRRCSRRRVRCAAGAAAPRHTAADSLRVRLRAAREVRGVASVDAQGAGRGGASSVRACARARRRWLRLVCSCGGGASCALASTSVALRCVLIATEG